MQNLKLLTFLGHSIVFFFIFQSLWSPFLIRQDSVVNDVCALISKITAVLLILQCVTSYFNKSVKLNNLIAVFLIYGSLLVSTIIEEGDIRRFFSMFYCPLGLAAYFTICSKNIKVASRFLGAVGPFMYLITFIEFVFILAFPNGIFINGSKTGLYFLGGENLLGFPLMVALLLVYSDYYLNHKSKRYLYSFILMHILSIVMVFSGGNLSGTLLAYVIILFPVVRPVVSRVSLSKIILVFVAVFVVIIVFQNLENLLSLPIVQYLIQDLLGKNLTLTNRTVIWIAVIEGIVAHPIFGNGIRESVNLFFFHHSKYSAHNQFLQSLYEGGIMLYLAAIPLVVMSSKAIRDLRKAGIVFKAVPVGIMTMYMSEASGLLFLVMVLSFILAFAPIMHEVQKMRG